MLFTKNLGGPVTVQNPKISLCRVGEDWNPAFLLQRQCLLFPLHCVQRLPENDSQVTGEELWFYRIQIGPRNQTRYSGFHCLLSKMIENV